VFLCPWLSFDVEFAKQVLMTGKSLRIFSGSVSIVIKRPTMSDENNIQLCSGSIKYNNNNNNNNIYLLQFGYQPVAVVILHVNKT